MGAAIMFGNYGGSTATWKFNAGGIAWSKLAGPSPSARYQSEMVYDASDGYVLLFGGCDSTSSQCYNQVGALLGQTWRFSNGTWTDLTLNLSGSPSARHFFGMTYDATDRYVVLFGGDNLSNGGAKGSFLGDTWSFHAGKWTLLHPKSAPTPRDPGGMTFDVSDHYVLLFGGYTGSYPGLLADSWQFISGNWTRLVTAIHPSAREWTAMSGDGVAGGVVLFGGYNATYLGPGFLGDTWTFKNGTWSALHPGSSPTNSAGASLVFDPINHELLLVGGTRSYSGNYSGDTWIFNGHGWILLTPGRSPPASAFAAATFDSADHYGVLFGGVDAHGLRPTTWTFDRFTG
jgi:hypothetical protein